MRNFLLTLNQRVWFTRNHTSHERSEFDEFSLFAIIW